MNQTHYRVSTRTSQLKFQACFSGDIRTSKNLNQKTLCIIHQSFESLHMFRLLERSTFLLSKNIDYRSSPILTKFFSSNSNLLSNDFDNIVQDEHIVFTVRTL